MINAHFHTYNIIMSKIKTIIGSVLAAGVIAAGGVYAGSNGESNEDAVTTELVKKKKNKHRHKNKNHNDNYGYIYLESFTGASSIQFKNALDELEKNDLKGLIIDLRTNKGGYLEQSHAIASMFVRKGKILYSIKDRNTDDIKYDDTDEHREYPVVVLVNSMTASASELLAISLKESYGAILVGTTTYGKGKIQQTSNIGDSSMIKYTTATWYSPNHNNIDGQGIRPSYTVKLSRAYIKNPIDKNDDQLKKGLSVLVGLSK